MGVTSVATLAVDVTARGVVNVQTAIKQMTMSIEALRQKQLLTVRAMLGLWGGFQMLTSSSMVASAAMSGFGSAIGFLIDTLLLPLLPVMIQIELALIRFAAWFSEQGPVVRTALVMLAGAMFLAFGGPVAVAVGTVLILLGLFSAWATAKGALTAGIITGLAAAVVGLGLAFGFLTAPVWVVVGAILALVAVVMLLRAAWLAISGQDWQSALPSVDGLKAMVGLGGSGPIAMPSSGMMPGTMGNMTDNSIGAINVTTTGNSAGGRDAAIALQSDLAMRRRGA